MNEDSVIKEVRRIKEDIAKQHGYDVQAIAQAARVLRQKQGREAVARPSKHVVSR